MLDEIFYSTRSKAYASIACGTIPIIAIIINMFVFGWPVAQIFLILTAPLFGITGVFLSESVEGGGWNSVLAVMGRVCSIISTVITGILAILLLFFIIVGN